MEVSEEPNKHGSIISAKACCSRVPRESSYKKTALTYQLYNIREIAGRLCIMDSETIDYFAVIKMNTITTCDNFPVFLEPVV